MNSHIPQSLKYFRVWTLLLAGTVLAGCTRAASPRWAPVTATPASVTVSQPSRVIQRDIAVLKKASYTVDYHTGAEMPDRTVLVIFHSLCAGSADGHCQAVDVFRNMQPRVLWHHEYAGVLAIHTSRSGFSVEAVNYAPSDPLCCPSLPPVTDTFTWTGSGFGENGAEPRQPGR